MKFLAIYTGMLVCTFLSCRDKEGNSGKTNYPVSTGKIIVTKPPSNFRDTLIIDFATAVFYHPDSLQLEKIKEMTERGVFEATMHEFSSQMRNARMTIKRGWPSLKIMETKNARFLLFRGKGINTTIDLNTKGDPYGLFLFQPGTEPHFTDMMNIDTELGFYFKIQAAPAR